MFYTKCRKLKPYPPSRTPSLPPYLPLVLSRSLPNPQVPLHLAFGNGHMEIIRLLLQVFEGGRERGREGASEGAREGGRVGGRAGKRAAAGGREGGREGLGLRV